ncbi:MAG: hypothetical protein NVS9B15_13960 [Acidobacteriaceae bacterium]
MDSKLILITCLIKLGVSAAVASAVMRSRIFKDLLFRHYRELRQELQMLAFIAIPIALGVWVRTNVRNFYAADIAFETTILMGLIGGRLAAMVAAVFLALPAMFHGEYLTLPVLLVLGLIGGICRDAAHNPEDIWSFSPFMDLSIYRWLKRVLRNPFRLDWQIGLFVVIIVLQLVRMELARFFPNRLFSLDSPRLVVQLAIYATVVACVAIPLKVWNVNRIELKLEQQEKLLLQARLDALQSQINPHFLFNTLNSVSSLVRFQPETAREVILKLSKILRALLSRHDAFVSLRDEIGFIEDYIDIEVVRFGKDKLCFVKEVEEECLNVIVPSMLLQPLVENSIKHGIAPRLEGGTIWLRTQLVSGERLHNELEDNGVGMRGSAAARSDESTRIGMQNIAERLKVLYGDEGFMRVNPGSKESGPLITIDVPVLYRSGNLSDSAASTLYSLRSTTR